MKKVIGIIGVFALALSMFLSTTSIQINDIKNISLSDLALINTASAEDPWLDKIYGCTTYTGQASVCTHMGCYYSGGSSRPPCTIQ